MSPTTLPSIRRRTDPGLTGRHVLFATVAFFGVIFAVNGVLLWKAISTHSGLVANEPYRKGLAYNERIEADARQQALGWIEGLSLDPREGLIATLASRAGDPITGLVLTGTLGRPSTVRHDVALHFVERAPGRYVAPVSGVEPGAWLATIDAKQAGQASPDALTYRMKRRLWLKQ